MAFNGVSEIPDHLYQGLPTVGKASVKRAKSVVFVEMDQPGNILTFQICYLAAYCKLRVTDHVTSHLQQFGTTYQGIMSVCIVFTELRDQRRGDDIHFRFRHLRRKSREPFP